MITAFFFLSSCGGNVQDASSLPISEGVSPVQVNAGPESVESSYRLRVGDTIRIVVFGESDLSMEIELSDVGSVSYPYLGKLELRGKTLDEIRALLVDGLGNGYLVDPKVSVTMDAFREIFVGGEVIQGGSFPFQSGLTVSKAIVLARGFTERAARNRIYVVSEGAENSKAVRVNVDYVLKPGDIVTVKRRFF